MCFNEVLEWSGYAVYLLRELGEGLILLLKLSNLTASCDGIFLKILIQHNSKYNYT